MHCYKIKLLFKFTLSFIAQYCLAKIKVIIFNPRKLWILKRCSRYTISDLEVKVFKKRDYIQY